MKIFPIIVLKKIITINGIIPVILLLNYIMNNRSEIEIKIYQQFPGPPRTDDSHRQRDCEELKMNDCVS